MFCSEPIYETPTKKKHGRHASISGPDEITIQRRKREKAEYENVNIIKDDDQDHSILSKIRKEKDIAYDREVQAFVDMVAKVRKAYKFNDVACNPGLVISPKIKSTYPDKTSIKLVVRFSRVLTKDNSVTFTCDVTTSVSHIICTVIQVSS